MKRVILALFATVTGFVSAQDAAPATMVIKAGAVWLAPDRVQTNAAIVIEKGTITSIGPSATVAVPAGAEVIDLPQGTVTASLVLAHLRPAGVQADPTAMVTPTAIAADAFDPFVPQPALTRGGIGIAYLSPGAERLVTGQGSVVRIGVLDPATAVITRRASLRCNVGEGPRSTPSIFKPPVLPGPDDPFKPTEPQGPKTRAAAIAGLRSLFTKAQAERKSPQAPAEDDVDLRPFIDALEGKLVVRVAADREADITRVIDLAREFKLKLVIEGGNEAGAVAAQLKDIDAAVVLRVTDLAPVGRSDLAPMFRAAGEGDPTTPRRLAAAGVRFAIIPPTDAEASNLALWAAKTVAWGLGPQDAFAAITTRAAEVIGADKAVGSLAPNRVADLVAWPGSPFDVTARPRLVLAQGRLTHRAKSRDDLVAITARRIHTCNGDAIDNATIVVDQGKIRSVGRDVAIPPDARRFVYPDAVIVPGFVDGGTQVGIRGYQLISDDAIEPTPPLGALGLEQFPSKYFDVELPSVRAAAAAGVTTVALSPGLGRLTAGTVSVVKTSGARADRLSKIGGVLFDMRALAPGESTRKQIDSVLESGKKYHESWVAYEKALDEWKKGKKPDDKQDRVVGAVKAPRPRDPVSGSWSGNVRVSIIPRPIPFSMTLKLDGTKVTGSITSQMSRGRSVDFSGHFQDGQLSAEFDTENQHITITATVGRDSMSGSARLGEGIEATFDATRTEGGGEADSDKPADDKSKDDKKSDKDDGRPKPPAKVEAQEPFREIFADRASAFVAVVDDQIVDAVIDVFRTKYDVRVVIVTTQDIRHFAGRLGAAGVALAPTAASIREEEGVLINPALIGVQAKMPVLFRSGPDGDSRTLYRIAEMAVRDGVDPEDALRMITRQPARFLGMLDRVGSLERGKDADLVILSGEPFNGTTRVTRVMVDGRFVDEETTK